MKEVICTKFKVFSQKLSLLHKLYSEILILNTQINSFQMERPGIHPDFVSNVLCLKMTKIQAGIGFYIFWK